VRLRDHNQNNMVPRDQACYTFHTDYTMYADLNARLRGLKHVYMQYLGRAPQQIKLYQSAVQQSRMPGLPSRCELVRRRGDSQSRPENVADGQGPPTQYDHRGIVSRVVFVALVAFNCISGIYCAGMGADRDWNPALSVFTGFAGVSR
jgi:hypothetical protein